VGDIVEAQLSFVVIPVKAGRRKMLTVLRSLTLLDGAYTIKSASVILIYQFSGVNLKICSGRKTTSAQGITYLEAQGWLHQQGSKP
jgi:hypothetical protein